MRGFIAVAVCALGIALGGCGGSSEPAATAEEVSVETTAPDPPPQKARYPVPQSAPGKKPLGKLVVKEVKRGNGPVARWGDEVAVRYVGVYYDTGKIYSQHWWSTYELELDGKTPGPGWQKGIHGMRVGEQRELLIPSDLLFGDGDLAYVVEMLKVNANAKTYPQRPPFSAITVKGAKTPQFDPPAGPAPKKLLSRELERGFGPPARRGDEVAIRYAGAVYETGEVRYGGTTQLFELGAGGLGEAFERGIEGMKLDARRELIVPSRFLGNSGAVDYVIEVTRFVPASEREGG